MNRRQFSLLLLIWFSLLTARSAAEQDSRALYGSWVKTKVTYANGDELPDEDPAKCGYQKFIFSEPDMMGITEIYSNHSTPFSFEFSNGDILMKSSAGFVFGKFHLLLLTNEKLVLIRLGFPAPGDSLKYSFVREKIFQNSSPLTSYDIYSVRNNDTVYSESPKLYATYKDGYFQQFMSDYIEEDKAIKDKNVEFSACFTVFKNGVADSLRILHDIDPGFDKRFLKAFNKAKNRWKPAVLKGKNVDVELFVYLGHFTTDNVISDMNYRQEANTAYLNKDYKTALYFFNETIRLRPRDVTHLFERGICKKMLGDLAGACEDWEKVKELGGMEADGVLAKYCH